MTGTMRQNQPQHIPNEIVTAKPKVGEKVYYRKERYFVISTKAISEQVCYYAINFWWGI